MAMASRVQPTNPPSQSSRSGHCTDVMEIVAVLGGEQVVVEPELLTLQNVADILGMRGIISTQTVRKWIREGKLEAINFGGSVGYRIARSALDKMLVERARETSVRRAARELAAEERPESLPL